MGNTFEQAVAEEVYGKSNGGSPDVPAQEEASAMAPEEYCRRTIGPIELILDERAEWFVTASGWERFVHEDDEQAYQVLLVSAPKDADLGSLGLEEASHPGHRSVKVTPDERLVVMNVEGEDLYTDDLAMILAINKSLQSGNPLEKVISLPRPPEKSKLAKKESKPQGNETFTGNQLAVVQELWRKPQEICHLLGISRSAHGSRLLWARERVGVATTHELFFYAVEHGLIDPHTAEINATWDPSLTRRHIEVIRTLHLPTADLSATLGRGASQSTVSRLLSRTGAGTRYELWILGVQKGVVDFPKEDQGLAYEAAKEEKQEHPAPQAFTELQLAAVKESWRTYEDATDTLGISTAALNGRFQSARERIGVRTTRELFFYAVNEGIVDPSEVELESTWQPTPDLQDVRLIENLHLSNKEIRRVLGGRFSNRLAQLLERTGAKTRYELWILAVQNGAIEAPKPRA